MLTPKTSFSTQLVFTIRLLNYRQDTPLSSLESLSFIEAIEPRANAGS